MKVSAGFFDSESHRKLSAKIGSLTILGLQLFFSLSFVSAVALAQGGPPLITDDPDTPGPGYWEINLSSLLEKSSSERRLEAPFADINYGVGKRIQLKFEIPWLNVRQNGNRNQSGPGNSNFGVKWRFLGQEGKRIAWSIYPQLEVNTKHSVAERGLVDEGRQFLFPTEVTLEMGRFEFNGEVGRNFVQKGESGWIYGLATEVEFHPHFELLGEVHGERSGNGPADIIVNVGGRPKITRQIVLLIAAGRTVQRPPGESPFFRLYFGLQFNLPGQYNFNPNPAHP